MYKDMLPIGSVVLLQGGEKRVMIIGRINTKKGEDIVYDYCACYYPEGLTGPDQLFFFNREEIDRVFFMGFQDIEEITFEKEVLEKLGTLEVRDGQIVDTSAEADKSET